MSKELVIPSKFTIDDKFSSGFKKMMNATNSQMEASKGEMSKFSSFIKNNQDSFRTMGRNATLAGGIILGTFGLMANEAIKFEDKLSDVAKTTGLKGKALDDFGASILGMSENTRTSIEDLATIGEMGGQMGVAQKDLLSFTDAANKFNVALGSDFGSVDEAVTSVSKINMLFKDTRDLDVASNITKVGSVINELGAVGAATSSNMNDFILRIGAMPGALKPSLTATAALGAYLEESGIDAQIASSGFANFTKTAATNLGAMAKVMGITKTEAQELFNTDTVGFASQFAQATKSMSGTELASTFEKIGLNSLEVQKVIGALSNDTVNAGTGMSRLGELTAESNNAFKEGTSLMSEYNTKNQTTAAEMDKARNTIKSLSITIGQQLLPVIADLMQDMMPMVRSFSSWAKNNKPLVASIAKFAVGLGATLAVLGPVLYLVGSISKVMKSASIAIGIAKVAMSAFGTASTTALGPIGLILGAVTAGIALYNTFASSVRKAATNEELATEVRKRAAEATLDQRSEAMALFQVIKQGKTDTDAYRDAVQKLDELQPGIIQKYRDKNGVIKDSIGLEKEYMKTMNDKALAEAQYEKKVEGFRAALARQEAPATYSDIFTGMFSSLEGFKAAVTGDIVGMAKAGTAVKNKDAAMLMDEAKRTGAMNLTGENKSISPEMSDAVSNITKSEVLLKIDNNGSIQNVNLTGGSNFAMNVIPAVSSTMK